MNNKVFKMLVIMHFTLPSASYALNKSKDFGFYVGGQVGKNFYAPSSIVPIHQGSAPTARAYGGLDFNKYLGVEVGLTHYPTMKEWPTWGSQLLESKGRLNSVDLLGKFSLPLSSKLKLVTKVGSTQFYYRGEPLLVTASGHIVKGNATHSHYTHPTAGIGFSYELNKNINADISYLTTSIIYDKRYEPVNRFVALGISYKFK